MRVTYKDIFAAHHIDSGVLKWTNMNINCSLNHDLLVALNKRFPRAITGMNIEAKFDGVAVLGSTQRFVKQSIIHIPGLQTDGWFAYFRYKQQLYTIITLIGDTTDQSIFDSMILQFIDTINPNKEFVVENLNESIILEEFDWNYNVKYLNTLRTSLLIPFNMISNFAIKEMTQWYEERIGTPDNIVENIIALEDTVHTMGLPKHEIELYYELYLMAWDRFYDSLSKHNVNTHTGEKFGKFPRKNINECLQNADADGFTAAREFVGISKSELSGNILIKNTLNSQYYLIKGENVVNSLKDLFHLKAHESGFPNNHQMAHEWYDEPDPNTHNPYEYFERRDVFVIKIIFCDKSQLDEEYNTLYEQYKPKNLKSNKEMLNEMTPEERKEYLKNLLDDQFNLF